MVAVSSHGARGMSTISVREILARVGGMEGVTDEADRARRCSSACVLSTNVPEGLNSIGDTKRSEWTRCLETCELAALMLCGNGDIARLSKTDLRTLQDLCSNALDFHCAIGDTAGATTLKRALTTACFAVLADRVDDWRRWRKMAGWPADGMSAKPGDWADRLLLSTSDAFLRLVRNEDKTDLCTVANLVADLRRDQAANEAAYLAVRNGSRQAAALEVISFYHFAKAVESVAELVGHENEGNALGNVDVHMRHAIEAADVGCNIEWAVLLCWLRAALQRIVERVGLGPVDPGTVDAPTCEQQETMTYTLPKPPAPEDVSCRRRAPRRDQ